jgi:3-isopropylmalate dehydrogenase
VSLLNGYRIAVFPGDGIGHEITAPAVDLVERALRAAGAPGMRAETLPGGASAYRDLGEALPAAAMDTARASDAIFLAAMGDPEIRHPDGTEITPQVDMRMALGLYAGVRPVRTFPGMPVPLSDPRARSIDMVLIRESTEGLFAPAGAGSRTDTEARETLVITRSVTEKLSDFAFDLAARRKAEGRPGRVTCIDKANIFPAFAFMREVFYERRAAHPNVDADHMYVDAAAMHLVKRPWDFDVAITENMFGDILSDLGAALMGGLGFAPSADIGDDHAVFQPCHGSAPDIAGKGWANPTAMILSGAMMLDWLGARHGDAATRDAGHLLRRAVESAYAEGGLLPREAGGASGTKDVAMAVRDALS